MRTTHHKLLFALVALSLLTASGCSPTYTFVLTVAVRNATDGAPVPGAGVTLDFAHGDRNGTPPASHTTGPDGRVAYTFYVSVHDFDEDRRDWRWPVRVEKDGFAPAVVDVKPAKPKGGFGSTTPIHVDVKLLPIR